MREGDILNGYEIVTRPTNAGGGMSQWAFARKNGTEYFLKMFLAPKFPLEEWPGSEEARTRKRATAIAFERRHLEIARRLDPNLVGGGNLVVPHEFFRVESTYVKVMEKVDAAHLPPVNLLAPHQLLVLLRSLAFSVRVLHHQQVVHGDIKPDNVMVERGSGDLYVSKLIDFDEAYVVGHPPPPEEIVGDPSFYSPELLRYIKRDERLPANALSTASDMFSLGLFLHVFLTGDQPGFDRSAVNYPAEALLSLLPLDTSAAPAVIRPLITDLLSLVPPWRPSIDDVIGFLAEVDAERLVPAAPHRRPKADRPVVRGPVPARAAAPLPPPMPHPFGAPGEPGLRNTVRPRHDADPDADAGAGASSPAQESTP
jgi:serine/threonine protein kinase